jgi:hypothetical protein
MWACGACVGKGHGCGVRDGGISLVGGGELPLLVR